MDYKNGNITLEMIKRKRIGQISLTLAIIGAIGTIGAGLVGGWFTANSKVADIDKKIGIVEVIEELHYKELSEKIDKLDKDMEKGFNKLETLIKEK